MIEFEDTSQAIEKEKLETSFADKINSDWQDVKDLDESSTTNKTGKTDDASIEFESLRENDWMELEDTTPTGNEILETQNETLSTSENINELKAEIRKIKEAMEDVKRERSELEENSRRMISKSDRRDKIRSVLLRGRDQIIATLRSDAKALQEKGIFSANCDQG